MAIEWKSELYVVVDRAHMTPGNKRAVIQLTLKQLRTGKTIRTRFRPQDSLELAHLEPKEFNFLYSDDQGYHFMNMEDYTQETLSASVVGDAKDYLKENLGVEILFYEGVAIQTKLPTHLDLKIQHTEPGIKGDSVSNSTKPATLESGLTIQVPLFIKEGEVVKVDTRTGDYLGRA
jgi:elongation factor P